MPRESRVTTRLRNTPSTAGLERSRAKRCRGAVADSVVGASERERAETLAARPPTTMAARAADEGGSSPPPPLAPPALASERPSSPAAAAAAAVAAAAPPSPSPTATESANEEGTAASSEAGAAATERVRAVGRPERGGVDGESGARPRSRSIPETVEVSNRGRRSAWPTGKTARVSTRQHVKQTGAAPPPQARWTVRRQARVTQVAVGARQWTAEI